MEMRYIIVAYYMTLTGQLDSIFGKAFFIRVVTGSRGEICPTVDFTLVMTADKYIIGDVEVLRARPFTVNSLVDVLNDAILDGQSIGTDNSFLAGPKCHIGIPDDQALKIVIIGRHDIEEIEVTVSVKNDITVSSSLYHDRFIRGAALRQEIGP